MPLFWFAAKMGVILFVFIWVRGTLPRFRYDQLMRFAWTFLFPVAMLNLLVTGFLVAWFSITWTSSYFLIFAAIAVVCAVNLVLQTHPISSALSLIGVMGSLAVLYLLLGARVHRRGADDRLRRRDHGAVRLRHHAAERRARKCAAAARASRSCWACRCCWPSPVCSASFMHAPAIPRPRACISAASRAARRWRVGRALFTAYLLPFEVTSVLILIAIVGAIVLARKEMD